MRTKAPLFLLILTWAAAAHAASIDMDDPRRALGRENDVRIDAQLVTDTVSSGTPVAVLFQIQNFSKEDIAIADKVTSASYDADTRTITVLIGSEVPPETLPHMTVIAPQQSRTLRASATPMLGAAALRAGLRGLPRYVQVKVCILRDLAPFRALIETQAKGPQPITDELFDQWFESNDTILLNSVPVAYQAWNKWDAESAASR